MPSIDHGPPFEVDASRSAIFGARNGWRIPGAPLQTPVSGPVLRRQRDVLEYSLDPDAVLFHPVWKLLCQLNETAFFIWRHCDGRRVEDLAIMLTDAFKVEIDIARQHVAGVIELFSISGFVSEESIHAV